MAIEPVIIDFAARGVPEVSRAFETVSSRIAKFEQQATRAGSRGAKERVRLAQSESDQKEKAYEKLVKDLDRQDKQRTRDAAREAKKRAADEKKAAETSARERIAAMKRADAEEKKALMAGAREVERIEAWKTRVRIRSSEMAGRLAAKAAAQEAAVARRGNANVLSALGRSVSGGGTLGRLAGGAMGVAGMAAGVGGGMLVADAVHSRMKERTLAHQILNLGTDAKTGKASVSFNDIMEASANAQVATGMSGSEIMGGMATYAKNAQGGDLQALMKNATFFAKLSQTTGTDINTITEAAGTLQSQNSKLGSEEMKKMLLDANAMSRAGKMSFSEAANQLGAIGSSRNFYAGNMADNQKTLIGMAQLAKSGGTAAESGTFISALAGEAAIANEKFKKKHGGKELFHTVDGKIASPTQLVEDVFRGTGGNLMKINELFGRRGTKLFGELSGTFEEAAGKAGGAKTKAGMDAGVNAVLGAIGDVTGQTMDEKELDREHKEMMDDPSAKFAASLEKLKIVIADRLEPWLNKFADKMPVIVEKVEKVIDSLGTFVEWFSDNPLQGIGLIVSGAIAKDIAGAAIGNVVKSMMEAALNPAGSAAGTLAGSLGNAAGAATAFAAAALATKAAIDMDIAKKNAEQNENLDKSLTGSNTAAKLNAAAREGKVTPEMIAEAQKKAEGLKAQVKKKQGQVGDLGSWTEVASMGIASIIRPGEAKEAAERRYKNQVADVKIAKDSLTALEAAITNAMKKSAPGSGDAHAGNPGDPNKNVPIPQRN